MSPHITAAAAHSFVLKTKISLTTPCVVGRFCVLYRKKKPRGKWRCPLVVSVSVIITASLDASKLWSVGLSSEPEIVHGCVRRRAGPPPVCRSRMRTRRACASCDANRRSMWSMSRVCDPPPVQVCLVSCPQPAVRAGRVLAAGQAEALRTIRATRWVWGGVLLRAEPTCRGAWQWKQAPEGRSVG